MIHHARRTVLHVRVTEHPTAGWTIQHLREAFAYDAVPRYLVFDNDKKYGTDVLAVIVLTSGTCTDFSLSSSRTTTTTERTSGWVRARRR